MQEGLLFVTRHGVRAQLDVVAVYPAFCGGQHLYHLTAKTRTSATLLIASRQNCILIFPIIEFETVSCTEASST